MVTVQVETLISAPIEECFDLARNMTVHAETMEHTDERVLDGPKGLLEFGDLVTFEAKHLGITQTLTAKITRMEPPRVFVDEMVRGAFKHLEHEHRFESVKDGTLMIDTVTFSAPYGPVGWILERLFLSSYMARLLKHRGQMLKAIAETPSSQPQRA